MMNRTGQSKTNSSRFLGHGRIALVILLPLLISGCQLVALPVVTAMHVANVMDQKSVGAKADKLWEQQRANVRELQANGDPMGDYLYALGNAQGWIEEVKDPQKIVEIFEKAIAEGSGDAQLALGVYYFVGKVPFPYGSANNSIGLPERDRERGLQLVREGLKSQCSYAQPIVNARSNRACMKYYSAAYDIWPTYRDGLSRQNENGQWETVVSKNPALADEWRKIDEACEVSYNVLLSKRACD